MNVVNFFRSWKGIVTGGVLIALSLLYNKQFGAAIEENLALQIIGYFLLGLGAAMILFATLSGPQKSEEKPADNKPDETAEEKTEDEE